MNVLMILMIALLALCAWLMSKPTRIRRDAPNRQAARFGMVAVVLMMLLSAMATVAIAGDVVTRRADSWTTATGYSVTAGLWDSWTVKRVQFYNMFPTNTSVLISVRYSGSAYTQSVATVTGDTNGVAVYSTEFDVTPGDLLLYTPSAVSTGKVSTTYSKHTP